MVLGSVSENVVKLDESRFGPGDLHLAAVFGERRLDLCIGSKFAVGRISQPTIDAGKLFSIRVICACIDFSLDLARELSQLFLSPFRPSIGAADNVVEGFVHGGFAIPSQRSTNVGDRGRNFHWIKRRADLATGR